jgi:hypothetical protein
MSKQFSNMRKNVRASLQVEILLKGTSREGLPFSISGRTRDFSRKGLGVLLDRDVAALGSVVTVSSDNRFLSSATVQWVRRDSKTGLYQVGLRLIEPKTRFFFKIAASLLLMWAFMQQVSWAQAGKAFRYSPAASDSSRIGQTVSTSAGSVVSANEMSQAPGSADQNETDESEGDGWLSAAIRSASETRNRAGRASLDISMSKESYVAGETIQTSAYRLSNPSQHSRSVEIKTWLATAGLRPISIGSVGSEGNYILPPGVSEEFGSVQLMPMTEDLPAGKYEFSARIIDPVTGDVLEEKTKSFALSTSQGSVLSRVEDENPMLDVNFQFDKFNYTYGDMVSLSQLKIANQTDKTATLELKLWLEVPGKDPLSVLSMGADGTLMLTPGADMSFEAFRSFKVSEDLPAGTYTLKARAIDPATGQTFYENASSFEIR